MTTFVKIEPSEQKIELNFAGSLENEKEPDKVSGK